MAKGRERGRETRQQRRTRELAAAQAVRPPAACDVCVVGGGAAGLAAAITCAEDGASTVVLERDLECGRTILATGNGRCNFSNANLSPAAYNQPDFVGTTCGPLFLDDVLDFFRDCGLVWAVEDGRLYPASFQAASVRNVLLARARKAGVVEACGRAVTAVSAQVNGGVAGFRVTFEGEAPELCGTLAARRVVWATGGGTSDALAGLGLSMVPTQPVLCPLACDSVDGLPLARLDGRRAHAALTLLRNGLPLACERGEVLFRPYGVSGIAVFNLSRVAKPGDALVVDLLPQTGEDDLAQVLSHGTPLDGAVDPAIAQVLLDAARARGDASPAALSRAVKHVTLTVRGLADTNHAQVTRGGLAVEGFSPRTLQSKVAPGLFAAGEALDVDGACGGFNLSWAWASGMVAGAAAAR